MMKTCNIEYKKIGEIANYRRGSFPQPYTDSSYYGGEGSMPFVQVADVDEKFRLVDNTKNTISKKAQPLSVFVPSGTVIVTLQGTIGRVAITQYDSYVDRTIAIFEGLSNDLDKKYFAYQLKNKFDYEKQFARGSTIKTITKEEMTNFVIPIPPIDVQRKIVTILDKMDCELISYLEEEQKLRIKQYEFWKNELLDLFHKKYPTKKLGELTSYSKDRINYLEINENNYVSVENLLQNKKGKTNATHLPKSGNCTKFVPGDILIGNIRPYLKKIWLADCVGGTNGDVLDIRITDDNIINSKFLYYVLSSDNFFEYDNNNSKGAKMPRGSKDLVMDYLIPVPSLKEQGKIVEVLDRFDKLLNDMDSGIPAEIELRKKQYEYYRNKLLSFEEMIVNE